MKEAEIELWYEEEKERLIEKYLLQLEEKRNRDAAKNSFSRSFKKLHRTYEKKMEDIMELQKWRARITPADKRWKGIVSFFR